MIEEVLPFLPALPGVIDSTLSIQHRFEAHKGQRERTPMEHWLDRSEFYYSQHLGRIIDWENDTCKVVSVRFVMEARWSSLEEIVRNHEKYGRVVVDGEYCYLVLENVALQKTFVTLFQELLLSFCELYRGELLDSSRLVYPSVVRRFFGMLFKNRRRFVERMLQPEQYEGLAIPAELVAEHYHGGIFDYDAYLERDFGLTPTPIEAMLKNEAREIVESYLKQFEHKQEAHPDDIIGSFDDLTVLSSNRKGTVSHRAG